MKPVIKIATQATITLLKLRVILRSGLVLDVSADDDFLVVIILFYHKLILKAIYVDVIVIAHHTGRNDA